MILMAKDRRKREEKVDLEQDVRENPRHASSGPNGRPTAGTIRRKKKRLSRAAIIIRCATAVLMVTVLVFIALLGNFVYRSMFVDDRDKNDPIEPTTYDTTPVEHEGKVAYYLVGILGREEGDKTNMLSIVCHDKANNRVQVMQLPASTYIDKADGWAVDTLGRVFANPKSLDWCEQCGKRLYEPDIVEGDTATHNTCGTQVTTKKGSAVGGLIDFVNDQLALPVDGYILLPANGMKEWVDAVGGIDVDLGAYYTLGGTSYETGVQTLPGAAVVDYLFDYSDSSNESVRMTRQREVFGALMTRMLRMSREDLLNNVIEEVQDSDAPARTDYSVEQLTDIVTSMSGAGVGGITVCILPGEDTTDNEGDSVYSAHKSELVSLLNQSFHPVGDPIAEADVRIPEISNSQAADTKTATLNTYVPDQTGKILVTTENTGEGTGDSTGESTGEGEAAA